ncbi:MAG TPA: sensor histidine kinase [Puia sp.]|nr:sensor histidine kinase [Puia sp.]
MAVTCSRWFFLTIILSSFLPGYPVPAQTPYLDSLKHELTDAKTSSAHRIDVLVELGDNLRNSSHRTAGDYYLEAYQLAKQIKDAYRQGEAMGGVGVIHYYQGEFDTAMYYLDLADSLYALSGSQVAKESAVSNKANIGNVEVARGNYVAATRYYLAAIQTMERSRADNKWEVLGTLYGALATVYSDLKQPDKTLEYDLKAVDASLKQKKNPELTGFVELYVVDDYLGLNDFPKAKAQLARVETFAYKVQSPALFHKLYLGYGRLYQKTRHFPEAIASFKKAASYARETGDVFNQMNAFRCLGLVYRDAQDYPKSVATLEVALRLSRELGNRRLETGIIGQLGDIERLQQHFKAAAEYYHRYIRLSDSLNAGETSRKINEIENRYQSKQRADSILVLQRNSQLQQLALRKKEHQVIFSLSSAFLLLLVGVLLYRNLRGKHRLLKQSEELQNRRIQELETERKLVAAQSLMKGQEQERSRLAKDLHDGVGGLLSGMKLSLSTMSGNQFLSEENARAVDNIIGQLDNSINELRRVSHNMMPEALIKYGLKEALENYCERIDHSGQLSVRLQTYGLERRMEQDTEIVLYRIIQELLTNVIKHAEAKEVLIQLVREADKISLTVEDDGKGFDIHSALEKKGAGLQNIQARAGYLDGILDIRTSPGEGTSVTIEGTVK